MMMGRFLQKGGMVVCASFMRRCCCCGVVEAITWHHNFGKAGAQSMETSWKTWDYVCEPHWAYTKAATWESGTDFLF
jgi:hypothetical protein